MFILTKTQAREVIINCIKEHYKIVNDEYLDENATWNPIQHSVEGGYDLDPSTFSEEIAKMMIGSELDGEIVRIQVDSYEYLNKRTGELMMLSHSYAYRPKGSLELIGNTKVSNLETA